MAAKAKAKAADGKKPSTVIKRLMDKLQEKDRKIGALKEVIREARQQLRQSRTANATLRRRNDDYANRIVNARKALCGYQVIPWANPEVARQPPLNLTWSHLRAGQAAWANPEVECVSVEDEEFKGKPTKKDEEKLI